MSKSRIVLGVCIALALGYAAIVGWSQAQLATDKAPPPVVAPNTN